MAPRLKTTGVRVRLSPGIAYKHEANIIACAPTGVYIDVGFGVFMKHGTYTLLEPDRYVWSQEQCRFIDMGMGEDDAVSAPEE